MKRTVSVSLILSLLLLLLIGGLAAAESSAELPYYLSDTAQLMTTEQWQRLEDSAEGISEQYGCGVYLVTLEDYRDYGSYSSIRAFAEDFYKGYNLGLGQNANGILLVLSMEERDYCLIAYGSDAHAAFTDYGKEVLENGFLDDFRRNDWYSGFRDYVNGCADLLSRAAAGTPLDVSYDYGEEAGIPSEVSTGIIVGLPLLVSFGACEGMRRQMKPVRQQSRADEYIVPGGVKLSLKKDVFVNRTVSRTVLRTEDRGSSGSHHGGGTTISSSGFSGHSGKF